MDSHLFPLLLLAILAIVASVSMVVLGKVVGPRRVTPTKQMPYESGVDPIHDTHRRFDVRFHLLAIAFLVFDVELLFLYPWAVAAGRSPADAAPHGIDAAVSAQLIDNRSLVFWSVMVFVGVLVAGLVYDWRKGVFRWR